MCSFVMSTSVTMTEGCHLTSEVVGTVVGRVLVGTATAYARLFPLPIVASSLSSAHSGVSQTSVLAPPDTAPPRSPVVFSKGR